MEYKKQRKYKKCACARIARVSFQHSYVRVCSHSCAECMCAHVRIDAHSTYARMLV